MTESLYQSLDTTEPPWDVAGGGTDKVPLICKVACQGSVCCLPGLKVRFAALADNEIVADQEFEGVEWVTARR